MNCPPHFIENYNIISFRIQPLFLFIRYFLCMCMYVSAGIKYAYVSSILLMNQTNDSTVLNSKHRS